MSDPQPLEQARAAVHKILEALKIARVVCVDDTYADAPLVEEVVVAACTLDQGKLQEILSEFGASVPDDQDVLKEQIRRLWDSLDEPSRLKFAKNILSASESFDDVETEDHIDAALLRDYVPAEMLLTLSPKQWEQQRDQLLAKDAEVRTLFLFDQDLSKKEGGEAEGGIKIIASLLARDDGDHICGLLTHTVTPEDLFDKWAELSKTYGINRDRFLVIPKRNLSETPLVFAQSLKLVALSPDFTKLKERTQKIIQDAAVKAASRVDDIRIYDLEHMVFTVAASEGMWEPDMLFRLHALFHRLESRQLAHSGGELEQITRRLRSVSHIQTEASKPSSDIWKIQKDELYESPEHLNRNHFPLELGDIFTKTDADSQKHYILLAQPCDLMVRSNGERQPEIEHVPVAEVVKASPDAKPNPYAEKMAYYGDRPDEQWYVKLKQVRQVKVFVLDLCVFNEDGSATLQLDGEASDMIRPSWKARYPVLAKHFKRIASHVGLLIAAETDPPNVKQVKAKLKSELTNTLLNEGLFKGNLIDRDGHPSISYNCRRVGRLSNARAFGLLMAYTSCLGRPAYDRDLV